jgi:hypothetical protein
VFAVRTVFIGLTLMLFVAAGVQLLLRTFLYRLPVEIGEKHRARFWGQRYSASLLRTVARGLAIVGAVPLMWFVSFSLSAELPRLFVDDPCFVWGQGQPNSSRLPAGSFPCELRGGRTSETKTSAFTRLVVIQGGMLASAVLALIGSYTGRRRLCIAAFVLILVICMPLMLGRYGVITLFSALCFFLSCYTTRPRMT